MDSKASSTSLLRLSAVTVFVIDMIPAFDEDVVTLPQRLSRWLPYLPALLHLIPSPHRHSPSSCIGSRGYTAATLFRILESPQFCSFLTRLLLSNHLGSTLCCAPVECSPSDRTNNTPASAGGTFDEGWLGPLCTSQVLINPQLLDIYQCSALRSVYHSP